MSTAGIQFTTLEATHLVVDISGWFTGNPVATSAGAPANVPPPDRKVTIISDSAMAGVRWNGALDGLQGMIADDRMESCRRLVQASCRGREGYAPRNVVGEINVLPAVGPEDILVIATGYDDWWPRFGSDFDIVMAAARAKGFHHVAWVTFRSDVPYGLGSFYANMNAVLWQKLASGEYPEVRVWDLEAYTVQRRLVVHQRRHPPAPDRIVGHRRLALAPRAGLRRPPLRPADEPGSGTRRSLPQPRPAAGRRRQPGHRRLVRWALRR